MVNYFLRMRLFRNHSEIGESADVRWNCEIFACSHMSQSQDETNQHVCCIYIHARIGRFPNQCLCLIYLSSVEHARKGVWGLISLFEYWILAASRFLSTYSWNQWLLLLLLLHFSLKIQQSMNKINLEKCLRNCCLLLLLAYCSISYRECLPSNILRLS